ncbi:MAG TPA: hypothetical protein VFI96_08270 [Longimicrobiaceae bacterium]|nr:hypothetical protein [Longimicrobiaceae bacterium]
MRYGRDFGYYGHRHGYDRGYRRGYDRPYQENLFDHAPWGYGNALGGYRPLGYRGAESMGGFNAGPASRYNMSSARRWAIPWNNPVPGIGVGYSMPYGMGNRGRYI